MVHVFRVIASIASIPVTELMSIVMVVPIFSRCIIDSGDVFCLLLPPRDFKVPQDVADVDDSDAVEPVVEDGGALASVEAIGVVLSVARADFPEVFSTCSSSSRALTSRKW